MWLNPRDIQASIGGPGLGGRGTSAAAPAGRRRRAAILLEAIISTVIFAGAGAAVITGLDACLKGSTRIYLDAQAADLAVTIFSEIQMKVRTAVADGPTQYDNNSDPDRQDWTWQINTTSLDDMTTGLPPTVSVEVILTHIPTGYTASYCTLMPQDAQSSSDTSTNAAGTSDTSSGASPSMGGGQ